MFSAPPTTETDIGTAVPYYLDHISAPCLLDTSRPGRVKCACLTGVLEVRVLYQFKVLAGMQCGIHTLLGMGYIARPICNGLSPASVWISQHAVCPIYYYYGMVLVPYYKLYLMNYVVWVLVVILSSLYDISSTVNSAWTS